jgi:hypothetical protein
VLVERVFHHLSRVVRSLVLAAVVVVALVRVVRRVVAVLLLAQVATTTQLRQMRTRVQVAAVGRT